MRKLAVYDSIKQREIFAITLTHDQTLKAVNGALAELRELADGHNTQGWINEYDLTWSTNQCVDKHHLEA